jgi:hypothetical protein
LRFDILNNSAHVRASLCVSPLHREEIAVSVGDAEEDHKHSAKAQTSNAKREAETQKDNSPDKRS